MTNFVIFWATGKNLGTRQYLLQAYGVHVSSCTQDFMPLGPYIFSKTTALR